jgi:molybdopterin-guanine dinucleotide biosynthesis protein A
MKITGVILAGGKGSRLGGVDKGLIEFRARPLIAWVIDRIRPQVDEILISANRNPDIYAQFGYRVIPDLNADYAGPLAGLQRALKEARNDWIMTVPCDTPMLPLDLVPRLVEGLSESDDVVRVACSPEGWQPTIALVTRRRSAALETYLSLGLRRVRDWIAQQPHSCVLFDQSSDFTNINTAEQLSSWDSDQH